MNNFLLVIFLFTAGTLYSQITFNRTYQFGYPAAALTSVIETEKGYDAMGGFVDSFPYNEDNNIFVRFDKEGNIVFQKVIADSTRSHEVWLAPMLQSTNGERIASGYSIDDMSIMRAILIRYDEQGDTIALTNYLNPFYPEEVFIHPLDLIQTSNNEFISLNSIGMPGLSFNGIQLIKLNKEGVILWQKIFDSDSWERPLELKQTDDGGYLIGAWRTNVNINNQYYESQSWLIKTDSIGNMDWEWISSANSELQEGIRGVDVLEDGSMIIASGRGIEHPINPGSGVMRWDGLFYKLDSARNVVWEREMRGTEKGEWDRFTRMVKCRDDSGYVACGIKVDKVTLNGTYETGPFGWLAKVSPQGDSLWMRYYIYESTGEPQNYQLFYDVKATSDGGFIMAGETPDPNITDGFQQSGWLVKVDEYGCLVPGCHLVSSTEVLEKEFTLSIYPNPTSDFLNIFYRGSVGARLGKFRIFNAVGQEMTQFEALMSEATHMVPVGDFPSGMYYLQYWLADILVRTEGFVVE